MMPTARTFFHVFLILLVAVMSAYLLLDSETLGGASDDLLPPWALARLAVTGHRADAYDLSTQLDLLTDPTLPGYRVYLPDMPQIAGIGLCPYPPTTVVVYAPLGFLSFDAAGSAVYFGSIGLALVAAFTISRATAGAVSSLAAVVAIFYMPDFLSTLRIGQNGALTLALLALGWRAVGRECSISAGLWWGLLAFKPQWLFAVGWLPLALGRPRIWIGMAITAGLLAATATAWLGPTVWERWLTQVAAIDHVYALNDEFRQYLLPKGCDLRSVLNRYLIPAVGRPLGWAAIGAVAMVTTIWYRRRPAGTVCGPKAAGLLFGCGLTVPHLYYYDEMVFLLPLLLLWSQRALLTRRQVIVLVGLTAAYYASWYTFMLCPVVDQPPAWTIAAVGLWVYSMWVFRGAREERDGRAMKTAPVG